MKTALILLLLPLFASCQRNYEHIEFDIPGEIKSTKLEYYPYRLNDYEFNNELNYSVYVWQDEMLHYDEIFEKFGFYGNGVSWEELSSTIIKLSNPKLAGRFSIESEAGSAIITTKDKAVQLEIAKTLHEWTVDKIKLKKAFSEVNTLYME